MKGKRKLMKRVQADGTSAVRRMKINGVGGCLRSCVIRAKKEVEFWRKTEL